MIRSDMIFFIFGSLFLNFNHARANESGETCKRPAIADDIDHIVIGMPIKAPFPAIRMHSQSKKDVIFLSQKGLHIDGKIVCSWPNNTYDFSKEYNMVLRATSGPDKSSGDAVCKVDAPIKSAWGDMGTGTATLEIEYLYLKGKIAFSCWKDRLLTWDLSVFGKDWTAIQSKNNIKTARDKESSKIRKRKDVIDFFARIQHCLTLRNKNCFESELANEKTFYIPEAMDAMKASSIKDSECAFVQNGQQGILSRRAMAACLLIDEFYRGLGKCFSDPSASLELEDGLTLRIFTEISTCEGVFEENRGWKLKTIYRGCATPCLAPPRKGNSSRITRRQSRSFVNPKSM